MRKLAFRLCSLGFLLGTYSASAQTSCGLQPLKPLAPMGCSDTIPSCVCDQRGGNCRWQFVCVSRSSTVPGFGRVREEPSRIPYSGIDPMIPLQGRPAEIANPLDTLYRLQQLQAQQQEAELRQQQLEMIRLSTQTQVPPAVSTTLEGPGRTTGRFNGRAWKTWNWTEKIYYLTGYVEALIASPFAKQTPSALKSSFPSLGLTPGEVIGRLDSFYVGKYVRFPIPMALAILAEETNDIPFEQRIQIETLAKWFEEQEKSNR